MPSISNRQNNSQPTVAQRDMVLNDLHIGVVVEKVRGKAMPE